MSRFFRLTELEPYVPGEQPADMERLIKLNTNENPYPPSPEAVAAVTAGELEKLRLYPELAAAGLREAAAEVCGVTPDQICVCNSSDEVRAFIGHGRCPNGAGFADLTYGVYPVFCRMFGVEGREIPLREDLTLDVEDYRGEKGTVFIVNPNAPTGIFLPLDRIRVLLEQDRDRLVVVDEAYVDFGGQSAVTLLPEYDNLLITRTFSKSHSLAGGRLGFAVGSRELIGDMNTLKFSFNPYNVNRITMLMGEKALLDREYFISCRDRIVEAREWTKAELRRLGFTVTDSLANFLFAASPDIGGAAYQKALRDRGILIRHFSVPRIENWCRITVGTMPQMQALVRVTEEILKEKEEV